MGVNIRSDAIDPLIGKTAEAVGLLTLEANGDYSLNEDWFKSPPDELSKLFSERPEALEELLKQLLTSSSAQLEGLSGPDNGETWFPIRDGEGQPTGLFITTRISGSVTHLGLALRWTETISGTSDIEVQVWAHLPLLAITQDGGDSLQIDFDLGQGSDFKTGSPVSLGLKIAYADASDDSFGAGGISFKGVKISSRLLFSKAPELSFDILKLDLSDGKPPADRSLASLDGDFGEELIDLGIALFTAQLTSALDASVRIRDHLLPVLGLSGSLPHIPWGRIPDEGAGVLRSWMQSLLSDSTNIKAWVGHWAALLGATTVSVEGTGTRADPWRAGTALGSTGLTLNFTLGMVTQGSGTRTIYPGLRVSSPNTIDGSLKLAMEAAVELAAIPLDGSTAPTPLTDLDVGLRLYRESGGTTAPLVDFTFASGDLVPLGQFKLGEFRAGLGLDDNHRPVPVLDLVDVESKLGNWPRLDLSAASAVLDGIGSAAGNLIQDQLLTLLDAAGSGAAHPGRHLAALLGLIPPTSGDAPSSWSPKLVLDSSQLTEFLSDPLSVIACYHAECLELQDSGAPLWRFLLPDLLGLLHDSGVALPTIDGTGNEADPWSVILANDTVGTARLQAWSDLVGGRPQLHIGLALETSALSLGGNVDLNFRQHTRLLHLDLPPSASCPAPTNATWLPSASADLQIVGTPNITLPELAGLQFRVDSLALGAVWKQAGDFDWFAHIENPHAQWSGGVNGSFTLPHLRLGGGFDFNWDFSLPDLGIGLPSLDPFGDFLRFSFGGWLIQRCGPFGFGLGGLLGLLPNLPNISFPNLPNWNTGPFALPLDWPTLNIPDWPAFFANPWPDIRLHLGRIFANPDWAWPALRWLSGAFHGWLPDLSLPNLGWNSSGGSIEFPNIPLEITGSGRYDDPWAITLSQPAVRPVQLLAWLDPDGPPAGDALDTLFALLPSALRDIDALIGDASLSYENLLRLLDTVAQLDGSLKTALTGVGNADLASGLQTLETFLTASDGLVLSTAQQLSSGSWSNHTSLPEAHHGAQLANADVISAINSKISGWSGSAPVLLLGAPWEGADVWGDLLGSTASAHFDLREMGVDPEQISLDSVTNSAVRYYSADLAVFNTAPGVTPAGRLLPISASGSASSQARQVSRLIDRIRQLHPGQKVIVVAHSSNGLAARAALAADSDGSRAHGVITVGTPHIALAGGAPLPWLADDALNRAVSLLQRIDLSLIPNQQLRGALQGLFKQVNGEADAGGGAGTAFPQHAFTPAGLSDSLPAGVEGYCIATRLPTATLKDQVLNWLKARIASLSTAAGGHPAVTHVGLGLRILPPAVGASGVVVENVLRVDAIRFPVTASADASALPSLPRLHLHSQIRREDGWLAGGLGQNPRLRWAELGFTLSETGVEPMMRLHDGHVDGVDLALATLDQLSDGTFDPQAPVPRLMDAMLAELTRGAESLPAVDQLAALLKHLDLTAVQGSGYAFDPDGWNSMLAAPQSYLAGRLQSLLTDSTKRSGFITALGPVLDIDTTAFPFNLLAATGSDVDETTILRQLLHTLGLTLPETHGYAINPQAMRVWLADPAAGLRQGLNTLWGNAAARQALRQSLRSRLGLDDVSKPSKEFTLAGNLTLQVTAAGAINLRFASPLSLTPELALGGRFSLDLAAPSLSCSLGLKPNAFNLGASARWQFVRADDGSVDGGGRISLDWQLGEMPLPYAPLDVFPLAPDFVARLGQIVPRFLLSGFAASLIEEHLFSARTDAGPLLESLGLAWRRTASAPWRLRPLDGLLADPAQWLIQRAPLGNNDQLDPTQALTLFNRLAGTVGLATAGADRLQLPWGLQLHASNDAGLRLQLLTDTPIALTGSDTLALGFGLHMSTDLQVGVSGDVGFVLSLPAGGGAAAGLWNPLGIDLGFDGGDFRLAFGAAGSTVSLLPFAGWDSTLLQLLNPTRLLPVVIRAAVDALEDEAAPGSAQKAFITQLRTTATALQLDSVAGLDTLVSNPLSWVETRFNAGNAAASAQALADLSSAISHSGGELVYALAIDASASLEIRVGRATNLGVSIAISSLDTGPLVLDFDLGVELSGGSPSLQVSFDLGVAKDLIKPAGISLQPSLGFALTAGSPQFYLYPLGDVAGSPDFRLDLLPTLNFGCEGGSGLEDCLRDFVTKILLPMAVEAFIDNSDVSGWLKADIALPGPGSNKFKPGEVLKEIGILELNAGNYDLADIFTVFNDVEDFVLNVLAGVLKALEGLRLAEFGTTGSLHMVSNSGHYGLRLALPDITLSSDPEVVLQLGDDSSWLDSAGQSGYSDGGIFLYLVQKTGSSFAFKALFELVSIGLDLSGPSDQPLLSSGGFRLGGVGGRLFLSVDADSGNVDFGGQLSVDDMALPLGSGGDNPVVSNLLSSDSQSGGENTAVNPAFSLSVAYASELSVKIGDQTAGDTEIWFPIQRTFGPISIDQLGIGWVEDDEALRLLVDGGVSLAGLTVEVDDLYLQVPIKTPGTFSSWKLGLRGIGISYQNPGLRVTGALREVREGDSVRYDGLCLVEVSGRTFTALGSYSVIQEQGKDGPVSVFVFVLLPIPLGGPPYFFIKGLAGGFGYNRGLVVPEVDKIPQFPLIQAAQGHPDFSDKPMLALARLGPAVPPKRGSYWLSGGLKFSSFELAHSVGLLYVLLDRGFEIGLLGVTQMELPENKPLANLELALRIRFSTNDGVFSAEARLSENSWLLSRDCRLTGGFAFFVWFDGPHSGDFVISMGGYHPRFAKPAHFPDVPRLGFNWRVSSKITIKGESYFALTPSCVMAGGLLEAAYKSGNLKAWFKAWANFLIAWKPFAYDIEIGISIGVSYRLKINLLFGSITKTFKLELGAELWIWGPKLSGRVKVTWWVISFTVRFGANDNKPGTNPIPWNTFRQNFLPSKDEDLFLGNVVKGLIGDQQKGKSSSNGETPWQLQPEFTLATETVIATNYVQLQRDGAFDAVAEDLGIRPMHLDKIRSHHKISLLDTTGGMETHVTSGAGEKEYAPAVRQDSNVRAVIFKTMSGTTQRGSLRFEILRSGRPAALWEFTDRDESAEGKTIPAVTGIRIIAEIHENTLPATGDIDINQFDPGPVYPLPFHTELGGRDIVAVLAATANLLEQLNITDATAALLASHTLMGPQWQARRETFLSRMRTQGAVLKPQVDPAVSAALLGERVAPPQIASLYEGMAPEPIFNVELVPSNPAQVVVIAEVARIPKLTAVVRQPAQSTRARGQVQRTSVARVSAGRSLPRLDLSQMVSRMGKAAASLQRRAAPGVSVPSGIAAGNQVFLSSTQTSKAIVEQMAEMESRAIVSRATGQRLATAGDADAPAPAAGVQVQAGTMQVWELPVRNATGEMPRLLFEGDQALRVSLFSKGGRLLSDGEFIGAGEWPLPPRTARIVITGLGRSDGLALKQPAMGAVTLKASSAGQRVVGWQSSSQLLQVSRKALLARGAVVVPAAPLRARRRGARVDQQLINADNALLGQIGVQTLLPHSIDVVGILLERRDNSAESDLARSLSITTEGMTLADEPLAVGGDARALLLYAISEKDEADGILSVGVAMRPGWSLQGVVGMQGNAARWGKLLARGGIDRLLDNGPLSPLGVSRIRFEVDELDAQICEEVANV